MFTAPDGTTFTTKAELGAYMDAQTLAKWEASREARKTYGTGNAKTAEQVAGKYTGRWDASMPSYIRARHNLAGR